MTVSNRLDQLVELTGNISNAFTIALYKADLDKKILVLRHHISLSSNFNLVPLYTRPLQNFSLKPRRHYDF